MRAVVLPLLLVSSCLASSVADSLRILGPQAVNLWKLDAAARDAARRALLAQDGPAQQPLGEPAVEFQEQWFEQPLDHFAEKSPTWKQRYWVNKRHYKARRDAPVIVVDGGETSGEDRLPFLDTGIADILAEATGGVGVVLEHRYVF